MNYSPVSRPLLLPLLCALSFCLMSCSDSNATTQTTESPDPLQEIYRLTADKSCNSDSDCALLAVGASPCGGPEEYIIYATKPDDNSAESSELSTLVKHYEAQRKEEHIKNQTMGICSVLPKPSVSCDANMCSAHTQNRLVL